MPTIQPHAHVRRIEVIDPENPGVPLFQQRGSAYVASCSCGWAGKQTARKASAASAWGMHSAAARRREAVR
jgi:hypothetical protein